MFQRKVRTRQRKKKINSNFKEKRGSRKMKQQFFDIDLDKFVYVNIIPLDRNEVDFLESQELEE